MNSDGEAKLDIILPNRNQKEQLLITLFDMDTFIDDKLGNFALNVDAPGGPFTTDLSSGLNGVRYSLVWEAYR
jgi:hypothetical protein